MKDQLIICLRANYQTEFQKAEGMHRFLNKLIASDLAMIEKVQIMFAAMDLENDVRPLYSHIIELRDKDHPIRDNLLKFLEVIFNHYFENLAAQIELLVLNAACFNAFMSAKTMSGWMINRFFDPVRAVKLLAKNRIHPHLVIRIMQECCVRSNPDLTEMAKSFKPEDWQAIMTALAACAQVTEQQFYELQFLHNAFFLDHLIRMPKQMFSFIPCNSSHVKISAEWLHDPALATSRLFSENAHASQTMMTIFRYGKVKQITEVFELLEMHLVADKSAFLQRLLLQNNFNAKSLLSTVDAYENGEFVLRSIFSWIEKKWIAKEFIKSLLFDTDFISHLIEAHAQSGHSVINEFLDQLDKWVRCGWLSKDELKQFLIRPQDLVIQQENYLFGGIRSKAKHVFLHGLSLQEKYQSAFIQLLNQLEGWVKNELMDQATFLEILSFDSVDSADDSDSEYESNSVFDAKAKTTSPISVVASSPNLNELMEKLHDWVGKGILSKQSLEEFLLPPGNRYAIRMHGIPQVSCLWKWVFRCYGEGKIQLSTLVTLFVRDDKTPLLQHPICGEVFFNSEIQQHLIQQMYCLLTLPGIAEQIAPNQLARLHLILQYVTTPKPFVYEERKDDYGLYDRIELQPNKSRVLFYIAFGFSDARIFEWVSKQDIYDALINLPAKDLAIQIQLLRAANDASKPLGRFFKLADKRKLSARLFTDNEWPRRLQEALKSAEAKFMPMQKKEQISAVLPTSAVSSSSKVEPKPPAKTENIDKKPLVSVRIRKIIGVEGFEAVSTPVINAVSAVAPASATKKSAVSATAKVATATTTSTSSKASIFSRVSTATKDSKPTTTSAEKELEFPSIPNDEFKDAESDDEEKVVAKTQTPAQ